MAQARRREGIRDVKIGVLGGTFNPVHRGHLALAEGARTALGLDQVLWIPAKAPPMKSSRELASPEDRCRMVELAIAGQPAFHLSRLELDRAGPSYTVATLRTLAREQPGTTWYFLLGVDAVSELPQWRESEAAMQLATFVVAPRPGASSAAVPPSVRRLEIPTPDISSSEIRRRVKAGQPIEELVPDAVARYIAEHRLYR